MATGLVHEAPVPATCEWYTPARLFERLGLQFDLDPCHPEGDRLPWVPARQVLTKREDGLATPWPRGARVWLNPPYGRELPSWMAKHAAHCAENEGSGVGLVFNRTDAAWFQDHGATADAILFLRQRIRFVDRTGNPPPGKGGKASSPGAGSMLLAWGDECVRALERCDLGTLVVVVRP